MRPLSHSGLNGRECAFLCKKCTIHSIQTPLKLYNSIKGEFGMEQLILDRVRHTRLDMRKQQLYKIFEDFDAKCMQLSKEDRLDKYAKMVESPFRFFRGSAYLFYDDMTKIPSVFHTDEERPAWIMGDMHMDNFGAFQNESGDIVYDVNDFDEGYIGSYLYDILRMSISIALYMEEQGIANEGQEQAIHHFLESYVKQLRRFQQKIDDPSTLIFTKDNTKGPVKRILKKLEERQRTHLLQDITYINELGNRVFKIDEEVQVVSEDEYKKIRAVLPNYTIKDISIKYGSGTASIGLKRYYILVDGLTEASGVADLVLEMKEVRTAIPAYFLHYNKTFWENYDHQGARVVGTQRAMHHLEDPTLDFVTMDGKEFYIRERSPYKKKVKPKNYKDIKEYFSTTKIMGKIAAKIHARADIDHSHIFTYHSEDEILAAIGDYEELFIKANIKHAMHYKETVNSDYKIFQNWFDNRA